MLEFYSYTPKRVSEDTFYRVLNFIAKYAQANGSNRFILSMDDIAENTKLNRATVVKAIKDLTEAGVLTIKGGGGRIPYIYEYNGPSASITEGLTLGSRLRHAQKTLRLYYHALLQFYDFVGRIFDVKEEKDHFVLKVYKDSLGDLGIPWGDAELKNYLQNQFEELRKELEQ